MVTTKEASDHGPLAGGGAARSVVLVGVDGSDGSSAALAWAAAEASLRHATLRVVQAWHMPTVGYGAAAGYLPAAAFEDMPASTAKALEAQVSDVLGPEPQVPVEPLVAEGPAAQVLLDAAKEADMLVVGSHGRGSFSGLLLGSVSTKVAHHAHCPVVIVRT